jgi:hypothetical protein
MTQKTTKVKGSTLKKCWRAIGTTTHSNFAPFFAPEAGPKSFFPIATPFLQLVFF